MNRKTKENKGFTFIEMLLSLVLLGFLSLVVGAGSTTALNVYRDGVGYAESRALSATLLMAMENDLRYAKDLRMDGSKSREQWVKARKRFFCWAKKCTAMDWV